jgi:hypothetical protein
LQAPRALKTTGAFDDIDDVFLPIFATGMRHRGRRWSSNLMVEAAWFVRSAYRAAAFKASKAARNSV